MAMAKGGGQISTKRSVGTVRIDEFLFRRNWGGGVSERPPYAGWAVRSAPPSPLGRLHQAHQANRADIHLNRQCHVNPDEIRIPKLCLGGLWIFGSVSIGQSDWVLWGDLLTELDLTRFSYPT